jgi:glycosyltransferase involved in cell wall biosynthesis
MKKNIIIDLATIYSGKGGAGGGIWSYSKNLLSKLDTAEKLGEINFICLVNEHFDMKLNRLQVKVVPFNTQIPLLRLLYIHIYLPLFVISKKGALHKLYFEVPFWNPYTLLVTIHDCMSEFYKEKKLTQKGFRQNVKQLYFTWINKIALKNATLIFTPSHFIKSELRSRYKVSENKILVTPLATSLPASHKNQNKKDREAIHIYYIAAFHQHKGQLRAIEIFDLLNKKYNVNINLFFRGHVHDLNYYDKVIDKINVSSLKNKTHLLEYDKSSTLSDIYDDADWVILLSEYEGFGLPLIEAQAYNVPVICSDIPTFREVGKDTVCYIDMAIDIEVTADKIYLALTEDLIKEELISKAKENIKNYSWDRFSALMINAYANVN